MTWSTYEAVIRSYREQTFPQVNDISTLDDIWSEEHAFSICANDKYELHEKM